MKWLGLPRHSRGAYGLLRPRELPYAGWVCWRSALCGRRPPHQIQSKSLAAKCLQWLRKCHVTRQRPLIKRGLASPRSSRRALSPDGRQAGEARSSYWS
jgi:hypothetical protein